MTDSSLPPASTSDPLRGPKAELAKVIPRRPRVSWWLGLTLAIAFALLVIPTVTSDRWFGGISKVEKGKPSPVTVRVPPFAGYSTSTGHTGGGGVLLARGEVPDRDTAIMAADIDAQTPHGPVPYIAYFLLVGVLAGLFTHHMRRSTHGRLLRVQLVSLALIVVAAIVTKVLMLTTALSVLVVPVALFAMVPTLVLDRIVGLATGTLTALVVSLLVPFDVGIAILLLVQAGAAGLVVAERPKKRLRALLTAGAVATLFTAATYPLMWYLTAGRLPLDELKDPLHSAWLAAAIGPAVATLLAIILVPPYQLLVGEITHGKLVELEDLSHPLLKQIADKAPGTWQHSLAMANMADLAANAIGANGRLVRVGAYFHDLGKSLQPKYFIENLEPGETSPHDKLPPETSCDAIFAHVTEGIITARKAGLHERIIDFMHMHHGNGVLEYFWGKTKEQGNPRALSVEHFRYPGVPPQSRETAILSICDAVEAASRTLKKPDVQSIDQLVQRIVYGKLHLGQLDESGLSMGDLRRVAESLRETIRHANHGRIEYPWQKAQQDASAPPDQDKLTQTGPRLDSLDRPARPESVAAAAARSSGSDAFAATDSAGATPKLRPQPRDSSELAMRTTAPVTREAREAELRTSGLAARESGPDLQTSPVIKMEMDDDGMASRPNVVRLAPDLPETNSAARTRPDPAPRRDGAVLIDGPLYTDHLETKPAPKQDLDDLVELRPKLAEEVPLGKVRLADLAERGAKVSPQGSGELAASTLEMQADPGESDPRMRRVTNPVQGKQSSPEAQQFAVEAKKALDDSMKPRESIAAVASIPPEDKPVDSPAARTKAATLPPIKPPTIPPPVGRRSPTLPPMMVSGPPVHRPPTQPPNFTNPPPSELRPPASRPASVPPALTNPPPSELRPPARPSNPQGSSSTAPPPFTVRPPGPNILDDMITLRPQYEHVSEDLIVKESDDGSVLIQPKPYEPSRVEKDPASTAPALGRYEVSNDAASTQPTMPAQDVGDDTSPNVEIGKAETSWARGLEARLARQLEEDFGTETPVSAPTRAELQALLNSAPDPTRQQSLEEIEALHRKARDSRTSEPALEFTRRAPPPTAEVDEEDIEAAIELAPAARRNAIGVAKKKPKPE